VNGTLGMGRKATGSSPRGPFTIGQNPLSTRGDWGVGLYSEMLNN
jgi:hypothetical protein